MGRETARADCGPWLTAKRAPQGPPAEDGTGPNSARGAALSPTGASNPKEWDAATYDRVADPMARWGASVLERLDLAGDETVLDAGCGTGRVTEKLLERLPRGRVIALDASVAMLDEAKKRLARFENQMSYVECDLTELSRIALPEEAPVDAVLSTATFHWVLDHDRLFENLASVIRPRGQLVAQCGGKGNIERLQEVVRQLGSERRGTWNYATEEETITRLEASGFYDIEVWTHPEPTPLERGEELETFLETVCLRAHVASLPEPERKPFVAAVANAMPEPVIDYVRLNILAKKR